MWARMKPGHGRGQEATEKFERQQGLRSHKDDFRAGWRRNVEGKGGLKQEDWPEGYSKNLGVYVSRYVCLYLCMCTNSPR